MGTSYRQISIFGQKGVKALLSHVRRCPFTLSQQRTPLDRAVSVYHLSSMAHLSNKIREVGIGVQVRSYAVAPGPAPSVNRVEKTMNQVILLGRVGGDPQKRGTQEHPVVVFSLATHANYQYDSGDLLQKTDWHRVCVFKPYLRESVFRYMNKGQRVLVQGRITYGEVKDERGQTHVATSIIADDVTFFSKGPGDVPSSTESAQP